MFYWESLMDTGELGTSSTGEPRPWGARGKLGDPSSPEQHFSRARGWEGRTKADIIALVQLSDTYTRN